MTKCQHIENDPKTLDPCIYEKIETHKNVTVTVHKCKNCGSIEYRWERQKDTVSNYEEERVTYA